METVKWTQKQVIVHVATFMKYTLMNWNVYCKPMCNCWDDGFDTIKM